jgi:hypothetical protein
MRKRIITFLLYAFLPWNALAQLQVDGKPIPGADEVTYITVHGYAFHSSSRVFIDFGQWDGRFNRRQEFKSPEDKPLGFRNAIEAVNYLAAQGWELDDSGIAIRENGFRVDFYVLKRKEKLLQESGKASSLGL